MIEICTKFSVCSQTNNCRQCYRVTRDEEGMYRIEEYLSGTKKWIRSYPDFVKWEKLENLFKDELFRNLFFYNVR